MFQEQVLSKHVSRLNIWSKRGNKDAEIRTPASSFQGFAQETGIGKAILHDGSESVEAKVNKVIVLSDDLSTRTREVEGV